MRQFMFSGAGALALVLAGCGGSGSVDADADGDGEITQQEAQAAFAEANRELKPQPGQYKTSMTLVSADIPGAPPEMAQMMGSQMNQTGEFCLTPEEAERGFKDAIQQGQNDACKVENFTMEGGDVNLALNCAAEGMGDMRAEMSGKVTSTSSDMTMKMKGNIPQLGPVEMTMAYTQERIGDCAS
jgi:hypothetical protein